MDGKHKKQSREGMYSEHLPLSELQSGIHQGIYHQVEETQKQFRCKNFDREPFQCSVIVGIAEWSILKATILRSK